MVRLFSLIFLSFCLSLSSVFSQTLPDDPDLFIGELHKLMSKAGGEEARTASDRMRFLWVNPEVSDDEKAAIIRQVNIMLSKKMAPKGTIDKYLLAYSQTRETQWHATVPTAQFLEVGQMCLFNLDESKIKRFLNDLIAYMQVGILSSREGYNFKMTWEAYQSDPSLHFIEIKGKKDGSVYQAPVLRFTGTDLFFQSNKDSTRIYNTAGDYNLVSRAFLGIGGKVTWEKMGMPETDVFAVFKDFKINLNEGRMAVDSVTFFYKSLLKEGIYGRFEDANLGFNSRETARYPYFRSYEGGIVIENLVQDVRYEGGFSIKGIRKIGSSYDIWVDYVPEPMGEGDFIEDEYNDAEVQQTTEDLYNEFGADLFEMEENYDDDYWNESYDDFETDDTYFEESQNASGSDEPYGDDPYAEDPYGFGQSGGIPDKVQKHVLASLEISKNGNKVMRMEGEEFVLDEVKMTARSLEVTVFLADQDSLYHPSMDLLYDVAKRNVILKKPRKGTLGRLPFVSSYHEFFLYFEAIDWDLDEDQINFTAFVDKENKLAAIESFSFFKKFRFDQMKGLLKFNPVGGIYRYAVEHPGQSIFPSSILESYKLMEQLKTFEQALPSLEAAGYIRYDRRSKEITPLPKLFDWAMFAREKKDYDAIQLTSKVVEGAHASMDVNNKDLELRGCQVFELSDSNYVRIVPINETVGVGKDRSLFFGGAMAAGKMNFYGQKASSFTFDYENFSITCDTLDSMKFVLVRNPPKDYVMTPLQKALRNTVFEKVSGSIHIDAPDNKSGKSTVAIFPSFRFLTAIPVPMCFGIARMYKNGIYHYDSLYFLLTPLYSTVWRILMKRQPKL
ncbi:MAG: hypothetical protein R3B47_09230 [Bacteroidia bacterium]